MLYNVFIWFLDQEPFWKMAEISSESHFFLVTSLIWSLRVPWKKWYHSRRIMGVWGGGVGGGGAGGGGWVGGGGGGGWGGGGGVGGGGVCMGTPLAYGLHGLLRHNPCYICVNYQIYSNIDSDWLSAMLPAQRLPARWAIQLLCRPPAISLCIILHLYIALVLNVLYCLLTNVGLTRGVLVTSGQ